MELQLELCGRFARLVPLRREHAAALLEAANEDRSSYGYTPVPSDAEEMAAYVEKALAEADAGRQAPFTIVRPTDDREVLGSVRFMDVAFWAWPRGSRHQRYDVPDAVEIGWLWLRASAQGTAVNTESNFLLLSHAFDDWRVHRVRYRTDVRNARSRAAIESFGGRLDGVLRGDRPGEDDTIRNSAFYSIMASEWPEFRSQIDAAIERKAAAVELRR
jgi:N-acetyltransferase